MEMGARGKLAFATVLIVILAVVAVANWPWHRSTGLAKAHRAAAASIPPASARHTSPDRWPDATSTGARGPFQVKNGTTVVTTNGAVLQNLEIHGDIVVLAKNVTIRNCRIVAAGNWGILQRMDAGTGGLTVTDTDVYGSPTGTPLQFAILNYAGMLTVRRVNVHTMASAVQTSQGLIEDSYFHDPRDTPGAHVTLVASSGSPRPGMSLTVRHNTILNPGGQTAAISLYQDFSRAHDDLIQHNLLGGGGYTIYGGTGRFGTPSGIRVLDNVFSRRYFHTGGYYGWLADWNGAGPGNQWHGNTWQDTGAPVLPP
jgi:hypothetical protein